MTDVSTKVSMIEEKIDAERLGAIEVAPSMGGVTLADVRDVMEIAKMMAVSNSAVPEHLQGQQGTCFAICMYALEWRMSPFAVANKSYVVNKRLSFESQLLHAVIEQRAPIKGRIRHEFTGEGATRRCKVWATPRHESEPLEWTSPSFDKIKIKNSPEWANNPDKQLYYHAVRDFCRVYFPDVILGVYSDDEMKTSQHIGPDNAKDVSPNLLERLPGRSEGDGFQPTAVEDEQAEQAALARAEELKERRRANLAKARAARKPGKGAARNAPHSPVGGPPVRSVPKAVGVQPETAKAAPESSNGQSADWANPNAPLPTTRAEYVEYAKVMLKLDDPAVGPEDWLLSLHESELRETCGVDAMTFKMLHTLALEAEE